jgi:hypothetical protein
MQECWECELKLKSKSLKDIVWEESVFVFE